MNFPCFLGSTLIPLVFLPFGALESASETSGLVDNEVRNLGLINKCCPESCIGYLWIEQHEKSKGITIDTIDRTEFFS